MGRPVSRIYLDACAIIYLVEAGNPFHEATVRQILRYQAAPGGAMLTSRLARMECRVRPLREKNTTLLDKYEEFFARKRLVVLEITADIIERATSVRVQYDLKTPDALHLATAMEHRAETFVTGDPAFVRCREIAVDILKLPIPGTLPVP